jgi:hypothetical protein
VTNTRSKSQTKITIIINQRPFHLDVNEASGRDLKALADIPIGNLLFREVPGPGDDLPISDDEVVELKSGEHFYDMPPGNFGARS